MAYLLSCLYSYTSHFMMYCLRHLLFRYDQSLSVTENYIPTKFHVEIWLPF